MTEKTVAYIYALCDPRQPDTVRYVGYSIDPEARLKEHMKDAPHGNTHKDNWLKKLRREGVRPIIQILETCQNKAWQERERFWIEKMLSDGHDLTNTLSGGEGGNPFLRETDKQSWLEKLRPALSRPERCAKISEALKGNRSRTGQTNSPEHNER